MFQNQMAQCFFIGLYDIETGDDFYFLQKKNWLLEMDFKQINLYKRKMAKMSPKITKIENWNVVQKQALLPKVPIFEQKKSAK